MGLLAALALVAAACGGGDSDEESTDTETGTEEEAGEDEEEAMEDEEEEEAMEDEEDAAPTGEAGSGGELVLLQWQAVSQANGLLSSGTKDLLASSLVLEPLAEYNPAGELVPVLATEIPTAGNGISEDGTAITWNLRDDVLWSDGSPFTAADVVFSWEYCSNEETGCSSQAFAQVDNVVADDDFTVTVNFVEAVPFPFEPFVGFQSVIINAVQFADCVGAAAVGCSDQNFQPLGTGPFVVTELRPEDTVSYEMNPNYRGIADGQPFFGSVVIQGGGDAESTARSVLEVGEADYAWNLQVAPEILAPMEAVGNGVTASAFTANVEHISLNQTDPFGALPSEGTAHPLFVDNPDLHRALSLAINRDELVAVGYGPAGRPTCNIWPVGDQSTNLNECLTQDVDTANELLDGLGYLDTDGDGIREADGFGPLEFDFVTSVNAVRQSNQELIRVHWEAIGVSANMLAEDASLFFDGTCASESCIWRFPTPVQMYTNGASNPNPGLYLNAFTPDKIPTSGNNWGGDNIYRIDNDDVTTLIDELIVTPLNDPRLNEVAIEINDAVSSSAIIPLIHRANVSAFSSSIEGVGELNGWDSEYWNIEEWTRADG